MNSDKNKFIHESYKKSRTIVFLLLVLTIFLMTVGYSANLSSILRMMGRAEVAIEEGNLEITEIQLSSRTNATNNGTSMSFEKMSDTERTTTGNFAIDFYRTSGSATTTIIYNVVIKNNTFSNQKLSKVESTPNMTSGTATMQYSMNGVNVGTTILKPGESTSVTLTFYISNTTRNTHYVVDEEFKFYFEGITNTKLLFSGVLATSSAQFERVDDLVKIDFYIVNDSTYDVTYRLSLDDDNFVFTDSKGDPLGNLTINHESQEVISVYLKMQDERVFEKQEMITQVSVDMLSPKILTYHAGTIDITVSECGSIKILGDKTIADDSDLDYATTTAKTGVFKNVEDGLTTYFYRGRVDNNYVSFAGMTWRIIKIDKYGTKVILDSVISDTATWASSNTATSLDNAISVLSYSNSGVKSVLDTWYTEHLENYSSVIKETTFCGDFSYQSMTSSGSGYTTYYFGPYVRNGLDSAGYTPEFNCKPEHSFKSNIGIISSDEVAFAGGVFNTGTTNYYLYNSSITDIWWTLSPSYYDGTLNTVGIFIVDGSNGNMNDWQNGATIANSNAIRPVITLDTDHLQKGSGTSNDPYIFS